MTEFRYTVTYRVFPSTRTFESVSTDSHSYAKLVKEELEYCNPGYKARITDNKKLNERLNPHLV